MHSWDLVPFELATQNDTALKIQEKFKTLQQSASWSLVLKQQSFTVINQN